MRALTRSVTFDRDLGIRPGSVVAGEGGVTFNLGAQSGFGLLLQLRKAQNEKKRKKKSMEEEVGCGQDTREDICRDHERETECAGG